MGQTISNFAATNFRVAVAAIRAAVVMAVSVPSRLCLRPRNSSRAISDRSTTTTEGSGTITEFAPGSTIVLKESAGPRHYRFGKKVVYVTKSGKELDEATVRTRVRVGVPVRVHYVGEGDNMLVDRIVLDED